MDYATFLEGSGMFSTTHVGFTTHVGILIILRVGSPLGQMIEEFQSPAQTSFATIGTIHLGGRAAPTFIQMLFQGILVGPF